MACRRLVGVVCACASLAGLVVTRRVRRLLRLGAMLVVVGLGLAAVLAPSALAVSVIPAPNVSGWQLNGSASIVSYINQGNSISLVSKVPILIQVTWGVTANVGSSGLAVTRLGGGFGYGGFGPGSTSYTYINPLRL
jgi:hypothetical protein